MSSSTGVLRDPGTEEAFRLMLNHLFLASEQQGTYETFLATKSRQVLDVGRIIEETAIHPSLFDFQKSLVRWSIRKGRAAIFAGTGLGKTRIQIEFARMCGADRILIVCPLSVAQQTIAEGEKIGVKVIWCSRPIESTGIWITNYQKLSHFVGVHYDAIVLDESSILKSIDGATRALLLEQFTHIPLRLCCTATPAPNDIVELANHAEFLGVIKRQEMLSSFFVHDSSSSANTGGWRLKGHAQGEFWKWVSTWAAYVRQPSDLNFEDGSFILPPLNISKELVDVSYIPPGELFPRLTNGIQGRHWARRNSLDARVQRAAEIIESNSEQWIIWCNLNYEQYSIAKLLGKRCVQIEGSTSDDERIIRELRWRMGQVQVMITKPGMYGHGMNWQHCHNILYLGIDDSYEKMFQSTRRCWRFGQLAPVNVVIITSKGEIGIVENVNRKERQAAKLAEEVIGYMKIEQLKEVRGEESRINTYQTGEEHGQNWRMLLGDCVDQIRNVETGSVGLIVFSPPFSSLFTYSPSPRDLGNCKDDAEFFKHFEFLVSELRRIIMPGRRMAVHCQQLTTTLIHHSVIGIRDFRGDLIRLFQRGGFIYDGEITIDKNPQAAAVRTHSKGLTFVQKNKDSSWSRPALADYIVLLREPGENSVPINTDVTNDEWIKFAHPVWLDISEGDTLNVREARENDDEKHLAALQLETIRRCVRLWSNPGEVCFDPFAGIASVGYIALQLDRKFIGCELKSAYFRCGVRNLKHAEKEQKASLFSHIGDSPCLNTL